MTARVKRKDGNAMKNIKINPVYRKELRVSTRTFKFALMMTAYNMVLALVALLIFFGFFDSSFNRIIDYADILYIYMAVACIEFGLVFFIVPILTSSSIAGERERQTLEILLTTTLKPIQIVIGKLESSISMVLLLMVSSVPVVSIVFSIGGIGVSAVMGLLVLIIVTTIYVGSIGIWCSAMLKKTIPSAVSTFGLVFIITIGPVAVLLVLALGMYQYYMYNYPYAPVPNLGNAGLILLLDPLFSAISLFSRQFGETELLMEILVDRFNCDVSTVVTDHWFGLSVIVQLASSALILFAASRHLDPLRKRRMKRKDKRALKELQAKEAAGSVAENDKSA